MTLHRCSKSVLYENVSFNNTGFTSLYNKLVYLRKFSEVNTRHFKHEQICFAQICSNKQASKPTLQPKKRKKNQKWKSLGRCLLTLLTCSVLKSAQLSNHIKVSCWMYEMSTARAKNQLQKPTWRLAQRVMLSVLVNEIEDCTAEPITGSLLSSNSQQLLCTGFIPSQDIFQLMLQQMPDRINRECVWRSLAERSWEKSGCEPRTPYTHTHTHMVYVHYVCIYLVKASHPVSSVTICLTKLTSTLSQRDRARKV